MNQKLSILQWNCRSIGTKVSFLLNYLQAQPQMDVLMLQSLNLGPKSIPHLDGYYYPPVMGTENDRVMVATYISTRLTYTDLKTPTGLEECRLSTCGVSIPTKGNRQTNLVNVYYPRGIKNQTEVDWLKNLDHDASDWVVAGDFNDSHRLWDFGQAGNSCSHLADTIMDSNLVTLNNGSMTRLAIQKGHRNSAIDLTLVTPKLSLDAEWETGSDHLQSDHLPIHITLGDHHPVPADRDQTPKFQYDRADWEMFRARLNTECELQHPQDPDVDVYYENIRNMILRAADAAIPRRAPGAKGKHRHTAMWWNEDCDKATAAKRHALRRYKTDVSESNQNTLKKATTDCQVVTENAKSEHWERFCREEIREPGDSSKIWRKVRTFRRRARKPERPLVVNGKRTINEQEKADVFAETFSRASQTKYLPTERIKLRQEAEKSFDTPVMDNSTPFNSDLTIGEVRAAIGSLGTTSKATGADPISYHMIRQFTEPMIVALYDFYQSCWQAGKTPKAWREAVVIAIPKDGKPPQDPTSYRPIALTPHLGKVYERVIKSRLQHYLDQHSILPTCQAGFRKGRNCIEHVVKLLEQVKKGHSRRMPTNMVAAFFDIKKAFDTVWHAKLLDKMQTLGITGRLYQFVQTFLNSRRMAVKVGSATSQTHTLDMGVPQGSVIAPLLFSIMLHDIEAEICIKNCPVEISLFADDLAIWAKHMNAHRVKHMYKFQRNVDAVQSYMHKNGFELSAEKTVFMVFSKKKDQDAYSIRVDDQVLGPSKRVKFLGVTITQNICWQEHIQLLKTKAMRAVGLIKRLAKETWVTPRSLIHLVGALVRSRLTYGHEVFFTATDSQWTELERVEMAALKRSLGVHRHAINDLVYQEVGWLPLRDECRRRCANFEVRASAVPNTVKPALKPDLAPHDVAYRRRMKITKANLHRQTTPLSALTEEIWKKSGTNPEQVTSIPTLPFPPWELEKPQILSPYGKNRTKKNDPLYLATVAKSQLNEQLAHHLHIFTDGSVLETEEAGCAVVIPDLGITKRYTLNKGVSIFTAELYAILRACDTVNDMPQAPRAVAILTDSKSSLQALTEGGTGNRKELQAEILFLAHQIIRKGTDLVLMWLPAHTGINGNERADKAAKEATKNGTPINLGLSPTEVINKVRTATYQLRNDNLKTRCETNGWLFFPIQRKKSSPLLPRKNSNFCGGYGQDAA
eukprot:TRINITY_DN548_c0_g1_i12.p1 TRINITY_DN548_c0_g1~~TRINITY_DN548_c0_g1_i12.p1  ORF type:complete len:1198 (+),score=205.51 TRINITY_DN548_c0_g1_i12:1881-5474(+)